MNNVSSDGRIVNIRTGNDVDASSVKSASLNNMNIISIAQKVNLSNIKIVKKDGTLEDYNVQKVVSAVQKSAARMLVKLTEEEIENICSHVNSSVLAENEDKIDISQMHCIVENALEDVNPKVAKSYRNYRDYKIDFVKMLDKVYQESQRIMYVGDKENSNADSALVSTKRSLIFNQLNKELYKKFFLTVPELQAIRDGYIYIHDMSARRDTMNCCLFDVASVLKGGFEMGNLWYNEPKSLDVAFDVIGDIVMAAASQQYGGFTVAEVDKILAPYAQKTFERQYDKYIELGLNEEQATKAAKSDVKKDFEQGFQGWEYKFNTVASSRGDYPFITVTAGLGTEEYEKMATITMLQIRMHGQGKKGNKKPVLFPKIVFLYDENIHGEGKDFYEVLDYYMEMIRGLHKRTYEYLGEMKASVNPLAYCEGGFLGGHLGFHDKIKPLLKAATASFGITALNELQEIHNGKSLVEDGQFAIEVMEYINKKVAEFKEEDGHLYALYGTPAENLCGLQVQQFRKKYGVVDKVSDKPYVSNSFHCHVAEKITPIQKQDCEKRFWDLMNGGKIQYVKYPLDYNTDAVKTLVLRAMDMGFYEGVNLSLSYCDDCGHEELNMDVCPKCGSRNLTKIDRMNGYLSYSRVKGDSRLADHKMEEIKDRVSM